MIAISTYYDTVFRQYFLIKVKGPCEPQILTEPPSPEPQPACSGLGLGAFCDPDQMWPGSKEPNCSRCLTISFRGSGLKGFRDSEV